MAFKPAILVTMKVNGERIRNARHAAGMTQKALAHAIGTGERNIPRWEKNQNEPRAEHIAAIAKATGRSIEFFYAAGGEDDDELEAAPMPSAQFIEDLMAALALAKRFAKEQERSAA